MNNTQIDNHIKEETMKHATDQDLQLGKWIARAAIGALAMYILDPERGAPRRAESGDKLRRLGRKTGDALDKVMHGASRAACHAARREPAAQLTDGVSQRASGMLRQGAEALQRAFGADTRTEAQPNGHSDNAHAAGYSAGYSADRSADHSDDHSRPRSADHSAAQTDAHSDAHSTDPHGAQRTPKSAYQSERRPYAGGDTSSKASGRGAMRGSTLAGASVLGLAGLVAPRSPIGMAMGLAGLALLVRATGKRPLLKLAAGAGGQNVEVEQTIRIDAPVEQVFDLFANYENFPRFMSNVIDVQDLGEGRSHWVVKGPAGSQFAWNAVLTEHSRPRRLAWESEPGAEVQQSGAIGFEPIYGGTRVTVRMAYRPPAGALGHALASLLGKDPKRQMDEDLTRMKSLVERGAIMRAGSKNAASTSKFLH
ncbi:SRPBCC family protein [Massilia sp. TSP1-1-2]|uniref:SRPBCC family protein n=1 Tax=Massilia sp. TSP1-1-2 TaxID=2804649 RepID=UPI003CF338D8